MNKTDNKSKINEIKNILRVAIRRKIALGAYRFSIGFKNGAGGAGGVEISDNLNSRYDEVAKKIKDRMSSFTGFEYDGLFTSVGLCFPYVSFEFYIDGSLTYRLAGDGVEYACATLFDPDFVNDYIKISNASSVTGVRVDGYIHRPDIGVKNKIGFIFLDDCELPYGAIHDAIDRVALSFAVEASFVFYLCVADKSEGLTKPDERAIGDYVFDILTHRLTGYFVRKDELDCDAPAEYSDYIENDPQNSVKILGNFDFRVINNRNNHIGSERQFSLVEKMRLVDKYLIAESAPAKDLYLVDLLAGARLMYFLDLRKRIRDNDSRTERLDEPFVFFAERQARREIIRCADVFQKIGVGVADFGDNLVGVTSIPSGYARFDFLVFSSDIAEAPLTLERLVDVVSECAATVNYGDDRLVGELLDYLAESPFLKNQKDEQIMKEIRLKDIKRIFQSIN